MSSNSLLVTSNSSGTTSGYLDVFATMATLLNQVQLYVNATTELGTVELQLENDNATQYTNFMTNVIQPKMQTDAGNTSDPGYIQADTAELSIVNSQLSQSNSFWGGLSQSTQQSGSDIASSISVIYQMLQQGILSTLSTLANSWK